MGSITICSIIFTFIFGGALLGISLRTSLPEHHFSPDSKDAVKGGMGLVATMAALVLGLLVASAKSSYDAQNSELTELSSKVILLDRVLAHYGPESKEARDQLRDSVVRALDQMWSKEHTGLSQMGPSSTRSEVLYDKIQALSPKDEAQRSIRSQAVNIVIGLGQTRWLMYEQGSNTVSAPLLIVLIFWLTALFISFGLFAPRNATVIATLLLSALSVSGAILLILEMYTPYAGLVHLSDGPLRTALAHLSQ